MQKEQFDSGKELVEATLLSEGWWSRWGGGLGVSRNWFFKLWGRGGKWWERLWQFLISTCTRSEGELQFPLQEIGEGHKKIHLGKKIALTLAPLINGNSHGIWPRYLHVMLEGKPDYNCIKNAKYCDIKKMVHSFSGYLILTTSALESQSAFRCPCQKSMEDPDFWEFWSILCP